MINMDAGIILDIDKCTRTTPLRNIIYLCAHSDYILTKDPQIEPEFKDIAKHIIYCNNYQITTL